MSGTSTNTYIAPPDCENCGTAKTPTYLCCKCIDKLNARIANCAAVRDLLMEARWEPPSDTQKPFDRGYNLAMMQVHRALNGDKE